MIIGIDATKAARQNRTGVENTVYELILHLSKIDHKNVYFLYTDRHLPRELSGSHNMIEKYHPGHLFWHQLYLPAALFINPPDVFLEPSYMLPLCAPKKSAAIIHDLAWMKFPQSYSNFQLFLQNIALNRAKKKAQKIIVVSNSTKKDLLETDKSLANKTEAIELGYNENAFHPIAEPKDILKLDSPYVLYVGRIEERKNVLRLISAFRKLKTDRRIEHKLVLAGKSGYNYENIISEVKKDMTDIILPGFVENEKLPDLIAGASVFAFPSLYEGFGLPVLEALACGVPVLTSNSSSLPEVAGDAAIMVNPEDEQQIADGIYKILTEPFLRRELRKAGFLQVKKFLWEKSARELLKCLEEL